MTTVGIASLVICRSELLRNSTYRRSLGGHVDRAVRDGIAWLDRNWRVDGNPRGQAEGILHHYYYLYGLQRVGVLAKVDRIGRHPWYEDGAEYLLSHQREDGSWYCGIDANSSRVSDTSFALLFLKRGTVPVEGESYEVGP